MLSDLHMHCFVLIFVCAYSCNEIERCHYESSWSILVFCDQWRMTSSLNMSHEKMSDFIS